VLQPNIDRCRQFFQIDIQQRMLNTGTDCLQGYLLEKQILSSDFSKNQKNTEQAH
jgi:hypothetical protein